MIKMLQIFRWKPAIRTAGIVILCAVFGGTAAATTLLESINRPDQPGVSDRQRKIKRTITTDTSDTDKEAAEKDLLTRRNIAALYRKILGRAPDPGGWDHYARKIKDEGWDLERVKQDLLSSREYAAKHQEETGDQQGPETGSVNATIGLNVRTGPGINNSKLGCLPHGTPVTILEKKNGWYKISYNGGEAWVSGRYITASGSGETAGAPNATSQNAVVWAKSQMSPATATGVNRNNGKSVQGDPAAWNYWCLAFVATAYSRSVPELSAPSAVQSYYKFNNAGKIKSGGTIPAGAPVFWDKTGSNPYGHIAIASGKTTADGDPIIITSGWKGRNGITEMTLSELTRVCGPYLGYGVIN